MRTLQAESGCANGANSQRKQNFKRNPIWNPKVSASLDFSVTQTMFALGFCSCNQTGPKRHMTEISKSWLSCPWAMASEDTGFVQTRMPEDDCGKIFMLPWSSLFLGSPHRLASQRAGWMSQGPHLASSSIQPHPFHDSQLPQDPSGVIRYGSSLC